MKDGIGIFLWKIAVALYLIANGVLGIWFAKGDFNIIFDRFGIKNNLGLFVTVASVIALVAGILLVLEMLNVRVSILDTLIFIIAIIWAIYVLVEIVSWITEGFKTNFWNVLQLLAVHIMVLGSLLIASKRFG